MRSGTGEMRERGGKEAGMKKSRREGFLCALISCMRADMTSLSASLPLVTALGDPEHLKVHCHRAVMETILIQVSHIHNTHHTNIQCNI